MSRLATTNSTCFTNVRRRRCSIRSPTKSPSKSPRWSCHRSRYRKAGTCQWSTKISTARITRPFLKTSPPTREPRSEPVQLLTAFAAVEDPAIDLGSHHRFVCVYRLDCGEQRFDHNLPEPGRRGASQLPGVPFTLGGAPKTTGGSEPNFKHHVRRAPCIRHGGPRDHPRHRRRVMVQGLRRERTFSGD